MHALFKNSYSSPSANMKTFDKAIFALIFVVVETSFTTIALQIGGSSIGALPMLLYTSVVGMATMLVVAYVQDRWKGLFSIFRSKGNLPVISMAALLGYPIYLLLLTLGTLGTTPSVSGIVLRTYPIFIAILTPLALRQRVSSKQLGALLLGFVSVYVIFSSGSLVHVNTAQLPYILLVLGASLATALPAILLRRYNVSVSGFIVLADAISIALAIPAILILHVSLSSSLSLPVLVSVLYIGAIESSIGGLLFYYCYKVFTTSLVGNAMLAIPFLNILFSFLLLGTPMEPYYFIAAILLSIGIFVQGRESLRAPEHLKRKSALKNLQIFDVTGAFENNYGEGLYPYVQGSQKALAIKLKEGMAYDEGMHGEIFSKRNCLAFTCAKPHSDTRAGEIEFVNDMLGLKGGENALVCMGDPASLEDGFAELTQAQRISPVEKGLG